MLVKGKTSLVTGTDHYRQGLTTSVKHQAGGVVHAPIESLRNGFDYISFLQRQIEGQVSVVSLEYVA